MFSADASDYKMVRSHTVRDKKRGANKIAHTLIN